MPKEYPCTEAGCGKTFLRPEHLSRHRLNHRPKQVYQCTSCPKRFVRKDLLKRHEKRHEKGMWFRSTGGYGSPSASTQPQGPSIESEPILAAEHDNLQGATGVPGERSTYDVPETTADSRGIRPSNGQAVDFQHDAMDSLTETNAASLFFDPSFNIPDPSLDFNWLFENISTEFNVGDEGTLPTGVSPQSSVSTTNISPLSIPAHSEEVRGFSSSGSLLEPWLIVRARLLEALGTLAPEILMSSFFEPSNLCQFYDLYFQNYHPHFPILHRPTLCPEMAPPLLVATIVTLGSTLSRDPTHFATAAKIHDSLRYIIFNTADFEPPASLWCIQTLLLLQAHEKMFSTRKHHQLAHIFHGAIITLMKRGVAQPATRTVSDSGRELTTTEQSWYHWIHTQSSNRTAFFGFVMDAQHSFMFGHTCVLSVQDVRLPLPCAESLWECGNVSEWNRMIRKAPESPGFLPVLKMLLARTPIPPHCNAFGRLILLHGLFSVTAHLKARESATLGIGRVSSASSPRAGPIDDWKVTVERAMDTWSFSLVSRNYSLALEACRPLHRMAYVAIYTDIADMHVLAGAPSLVGSLLSETDTLRATARVRAWSERQESKKALYHCLLLIQETLFTGQQYRASEDNLALRPWALYNGTLILWAYGSMCSRNEIQREKHSYSAEEYLVRMLMMLQNDPQDIDRVAQDTKELLQAVRESLEGCRWELLQEAYDTLGRLIEKFPT